MVRLTLIVLLAVFVLVRCSTQQAEMATTPPAVDGIQELTPPSELALMMREMAAHADGVKTSIGRGDDLPAFPKGFKRLMKATPTADMHIDPITFPTFGNDYLNKLDRLYEAKPQERTQAYNALVQSCANCHGTHCPGPLMRIKKMYVKTVD
jgi:cytochrome c553